MALVNMVMPQMGESIMECTVIQWLKKPGDAIEADDSILEVATDKVDTEVPASFSGILKEWLVNEGDVVLIGNPIARIETEAAESTIEKLVPVTSSTGEIPEQHVVHIATQLATDIHQLSVHTITQPAIATGANNRFYSPLVQSIAHTEGIRYEELDKIPGTGAEKRLTKKDLLRYLEQRNSQPAAVASQESVKSAKSVSLNGQGDIIQMDRMRKIIAERMVESKRISPHVSSFVETDMTAVVQWRDRNKQKFQERYGVNITYTPILIEAVVRAIREFPMINISVEGDKILVKKAINIGMAVALPTGNLIVPVIHHADQYNLVGLTKKVNDLTYRARENKLTADDLTNGTYTISNIGTFGNIMGTPIIVQPQVAIMAFGTIEKKPAVIETPQGDLIGIRHKMFISHSYDHRVVDGSLGGKFVKRVSDHLEAFDPERAFI